VIAIRAHLIGYNAIAFYLQTVLESTQTSVRPEVASVIIGLIQLTASFCTIVLTDRFGRKPILSGSLLGMTVGMVSSILYHSPIAQEVGFNSRTV
jgi:MFS family permease